MHLEGSGEHRLHRSSSLARLGSVLCPSVQSSNSAFWTDRVNHSKRIRRTLCTACGCHGEEKVFEGRKGKSHMWFGSGSGERTVHLERQLSALEHSLAAPAEDQV